MATGFSWSSSAGMVPVEVPAEHASQAEAFIAGFREGARQPDQVARATREEMYNLGYAEGRESVARDFAERVLELIGASLTEDRDTKEGG